MRARLEISLKRRFLSRRRIADVASIAVELVREALRDEALRGEILELVRDAIKPPAAPVESLIGTAEAASLLGMTKAAVRASAYRQTLPHLRVGRTLRFKRSELLDVAEHGRRR